MKKEYRVEGMSCAICKNTIENNLNKLDAVTSCQVQLLDNAMMIEYDENKISEEELAKKVDNLGYKLVIKQSKKVNKSRLNLVISLILMLVLMYFAMGHMMGLPLPNLSHHTIALIQLFLATIIYILNAHYFFSGIKSITHLNPNMDALVTLSVSVSYLYSLYAIYKMFNGDNSFHLYFETGAMILVIVSIGKYIEGVNKDKTIATLKLLASLRPMEATILRDNQEVIVKIDDLKLGDILLTKAGETIAQDGKIINGSANVDESMITGESLPVHKTSGDDVIGGTINLDGYLKIEVTKTSEDSTLSKIIELTKNATLKKIPIQRFADQVSRFFVPAVISISLITFLVWYYFSHNFELSMNFAMSVLVISCPCALGLATPSAIMVATGVLAKNGILIRNPEVLEVAHNIKTVVLDKTGTITENKPRIIRQTSFNQDFIKVLVAIEKYSKHPIAKAIIETYPDYQIHFESVNEVSGQGIIAKTSEDTYLVGNKKLLTNHNINLDDNLIKDAIDNKYSYIIAVKNNTVVGIVFLADAIKQSSIVAIEDLKALNVKTVMCTGDNAIVANNIAKLVGVDEVIAEVKPEDKYQVVEKYKDNGLVAMVGDGINDAIALTSADVSFAISSGSDIAYESSDLILIKNDLSDISFAMEVSRQTIRIIKQNLFWALFYNSIFIPLAAGVFYHSLGFSLNPMIGAFAMSMSSIIVLSNALRIRKITKKVNLEVNQEKEIKNMKTIINVNGMMCMHCVKHVKDALEKLGVSAEVSLENGTAIVTGDVKEEVLVAAIIDAGYDVTGITYEG